MPRLRQQSPVLPRRIGLLVAACMALAGANATAQMVAPVFPDPFAPQLPDTARKSLRFQKVSPSNQARASFLKPFNSLSSDAGTTGFDATNARDKLKRTRQPSSVKQALDLQATTDLQATENPLVFVPGERTAESISPYQQPPPPLQSSALAAAAANQPDEPGVIRLRRKRRRAQPDEPTDPYAPAGIRAGAFELYPAIEFTDGYNSNPEETQKGKGAALYTVGAEFRLLSDWSRHSLKADLRGHYTSYSPEGTPSLNAPYFNGTVDGRIDVTHDTHIDLNTYLLMSTDNPGNPNLQSGLAKLPIFITIGGFADIRHRFNRLEITAKTGIERTAYQASKLTDGSTVSNDDRNYDQYGGSLRTSYELTPGVKPFVEIEADNRIHDVEPDPSGYLRNSKGVTGEAGANFTLAHELTGEIAIGYTRRIYEDARLEPLAGPIGNASLAWTADALTTVKLDASSSVGESTIPGVSGVLYQEVGLQVDHAFRRWLVGTLQFGFGLDSYKGTLRQDMNYSAGLGLTYKISRTVQFRGEFRQDWLRSNITSNNYSATTFLLGIRLQR